MDILERITEHKKEEVTAANKRISLARLRTEAEKPRKVRPFKKRLIGPEKSEVNVIAEIKRASPSKGMICSDLNAAKYAVEYEQGGAAALSVLTDQRFFQGSVEDLQKAREATTLPVLRKDFLISSYQIYDSSALGADAVLLITRILSETQLSEYLKLCGELQMDALVEIHSETDLVKSTRAGAKLIGINNRNLSTFETDIETAIHLKSLLETDQTAVAESGIKSREDIEKICRSGIRNFLIGESLVRAKNPKAFLKSLIRAKPNEKKFSRKDAKTLRF